MRRESRVAAKSFAAIQGVIALEVGGRAAARWVYDASQGKPDVGPDCVAEAHAGGPVPDSCASTIIALAQEHNTAQPDQPIALTVQDGVIQGVSTEGYEALGQLAEVHARQTEASRDEFVDKGPLLLPMALGVIALWTAQTGYRMLAAPQGTGAAAVRESRWSAWRKNRAPRQHAKPAVTPIEIATGNQPDVVPTEWREAG